MDPNLSKTSWGASAIYSETILYLEVLPSFEDALLDLREYKRNHLPSAKVPRVLKSSAGASAHRPP